MQRNLRVLILGAGRLAVDVADMIEDIPGLSVAGFVVNVPPFERGSMLLERPVHWIDELIDFDDSYVAVCAIGSSERIGIIQAAEAYGIRFTNVVHPSARVSRRATIGAGTIISGGVQVAAETTIGRHVIVNRGALIGHHDIIDDYACISPGANLAANVSIGSKVWVGLGANIIEHVSIGEESIVGAGSLVTKDVPSRVKVVGVPAMIVEKGIQPY